MGACSSQRNSPLSHLGGEVRYPTREGQLWVYDGPLRRAQNRGAIFRCFHLFPGHPCFELKFRPTDSDRKGVPPPLPRALSSIPCKGMGCCVLSGAGDRFVAAAASERAPASVQITRYVRLPLRSLSYGLRCSKAALYTDRIALGGILIVFVPSRRIEAETGSIRRLAGGEYESADAISGGEARSPADAGRTM